MLARDLRAPGERTLLVLAAIFSGAVWLAVLISVIGAITIAVLGIVALLVRALFAARVIGNGVRVGPRQLPDLMRRIEAAAYKLGLNRIPKAYVLPVGGLLNTFAIEMLSRRFIVIDARLLEAMDGDAGETGWAGDVGDAGSGPGAALRPSALDFVIGHELGRLAAGHLATRLFLLPARLLPWLGPAYARACTYTCDRCGHAVAGELTVSSRALAILTTGPRTARRLDLDAYVDQRRETGRFWMAVYELNSSRPFLPKRVAALRAWHARGALEPVGRNPLSYPLAPLFGFAMGGAQSVLLIAAAVAGIAAAVAIPHLKQQLTAGSSNHGFKYDPERSDPFAPLDHTP